MLRFKLNFKNPFSGVEPTSRAKSLVVGSRILFGVSHMDRLFCMIQDPLNPGWKECNMEVQRSSFEYGFRVKSLKK